MVMTMRGKLLLIQVLSLLAALGVIALVLQHQQHDLARREQEVLRKAYDDATQAELRHHVALALSTISPLYNTGRDDDEIKRLAMAQLAQLDYGPDGYFFLYDYDGTNLMHPRQPDLVGRNLMGMHDASGFAAIRAMIDKARSGGGFVAYTWNRPSTHSDAPKLAYVTGLDRWHWMVGTGTYTDDLGQVIAQLQAQLEAHLNATMRWVALAAAGSIAVILASALLFGINQRRAADAKLMLLARKLVRSQEDERAWLSRELHDGTSQTLVSAKLLTESALQRLGSDAGREPGRDSAGLRPVLQRALARLEDALNGVRRISHRLRPAELDMLGLAIALRELGQEMCGEAGIAFDLDVADEPPGLPDEIRTTLFRVCQEALTNVLKHAAASRVRMVLSGDADGLHLSVEDDGQGFDIEAVAQHPRRGIGLRNMRERLTAVGGTLQLISRPQGTTIVAAVPTQAIRRFALATRRQEGLSA
jgi:two-component system NarL family sensor kinase